jgi:hypothetical protein
MNNIVPAQFRHREALVSATGGDEQMAAFVMRMAAIYGIGENEMNTHNIGALVSAAGLSIQYGYLPRIHIHMLPFNANAGSKDNPRWETRYTPMLSLEVWKHSAMAQCRKMGMWYFPEVEDLSPEETKAYIEREEHQSPFHQDDRASRCRLKLIFPGGHIERTRWAYGTWRRNAKAKRNNKGETYYEADTLPSQRTAQDVAARRAERQALMSYFTPEPISKDEKRNLADLISAVQETVAIEDDRMADIPYESAPQREDDGEILYDSPKTPPRKAANAPQPQPNPLEDPLEAVVDHEMESTMAAWNNSAVAAQNWAVLHGHYPDPSAANAGWVNVVKKFGGVSDAQTMTQALRAFYHEAMHAKSRSRRQ